MGPATRCDIRAFETDKKAVPDIKGESLSASKFVAFNSFVRTAPFTASTTESLAAWEDHSLTTGITQHAAASGPNADETAQV